MAMMDDRPLFIDTNVLLTATDEARPKCAAALALLNREGLSLVVSGQVLREYLVVATRPKKVNGFGMRPGRALENIQQFRTRLTVLDETERVATELMRLVQDQGLTGKQIHDANIVATMRVHGVEQIATLNPGDFSRFEGVQVVRL